MNKTILVTGANGQVGHALANIESDHRIVALSRSDLDIVDSSRVDKVLQTAKPDFLINAAAYTQVDRAEDEPERAFAVNRDGVLNLAAACQKLKIPMLHISPEKT